ncbi:MAG: peptidoglycan editing factor PgeF [Oscillospiraceae bacterium]|nr:peptidoglycan editing factor PgeF [Oscillospiraceae bacterium]
MFKENNTNGVTFMTAPNITTTHAFTTRFGGVSNGIYESLNLGQNLGDTREDVKENYRRLCNALGIDLDDIVTSRQVHRADIRLVMKSDCGHIFASNDSEACDGLITREDAAALMIFTADCVPILFHDPVAGVVGAVHAGWRGTAANIAGAAIRKMEETGCISKNINAAIGPCISKCCFETDIDVVDGLSEVLSEDIQNCVEKHKEKYKVDLKEANKLLLLRTGVSNITISDECTSCHNHKYWSHRRTKGNRGSQATLIKLPST